MKFVSTCEFSKLCESGIIAITNSNVDSDPLRNFTSVKLFPSTVSSPVFPIIFDRIYDFVGFLVHFEAVYYRAFCMVCLFVVNLLHSYIFFISFCCA